MTPARTADVALIQTTIPDYRTAFFEGLAKSVGPRFLLLSGDEDWYPDLRHAGRVPHVTTKNVFLARRQLLWQRGAFRPLLAARVAVVGLNPRIVTNWIVLVGRRLTGRRTVVWGHAWSRRGSASPTDRLRSLMRRLGDTVIVYTETEALQVRAASPRLDVVAAPNALYPRHVLTPLDGEEATDFVFVGRLNPSKKPHLLLDAFSLAAPRLPQDVRLVFVGDGPDRDSLERKAVAALGDRVHFAGHVSELDRIRSVYARAIASVSPGAAGLSLIQSLGFGVPMILARDEPHGPELEAAAEGNVLMFERNSTVELADLLVTVATNRKLWQSRRHEIAAPIAERYSIEAMVEAFVAGLGLTRPASPREPTESSTR